MKLLDKVSALLIIDKTSMICSNVLNMLMEMHFLMFNKHKNSRFFAVFR